jgi:LysM repeat protein
LFELRRTDYKGWAHGLKKAGYATNPKYPALLIKIIEENDLAKYDRMKSPPKGSDVDLDDDKPSTKPKPQSSNPNESLASGQSRQMYLRNNIRYVRVKEGDTYESLERILQIREWQIQKYNDLAKGSPLIPGELIYIQPKRNKNPQKDYHFVAEGETLRWISQEYGVKLKKLYQYNELNIGEEPAIGQKVWLRKRKRRDY